MTCKCDAGYEGGDCSMVTPPTRGPDICSGHGARTGHIYNR